jgi:hypothetical protein
MRLRSGYRMVQTRTHVTTEAASPATRMRSLPCARPSPLPPTLCHRDADVNRELFPDSLPHDIPGERARSIEIIHLLLSAGADPNLPTRTRTPLSVAVSRGDAELVALILGAAAEISGLSWSPLSSQPHPKAVSVYTAMPFMKPPKRVTQRLCGCFVPAAPTCPHAITRGRQHWS